jgi:protocatechuate 3,4-dioxygenase beta subunit
MSRMLRWLPLAIICCALLVPAGEARAQSGAVHVQAAGTASIWGNVTDNRGSPLGGATVTLVSEDTKESSGASTDGTGQYRFEALKPGNYDLTFSATGLLAKHHRVRIKPGTKKIEVNERLKAPEEPEAAPAPK